MNHHEGKIAGSLLFIGGIQCVLGIILAEALYPGYNTSVQTISSLGVGPSAIIFNSSVFLIGVLGLAGTYFVHRAFNFNLFTLLFHNGFSILSKHIQFPMSTSMRVHDVRNLEQR